MSAVEDAINNLLTTLRGLSTTYRNGARSLVDAADNAIQAVKSPKVPSLEYNTNRQFAGVERVPIPPKTPNISSLAIVPLGELQPVSKINDKFTVKPPTFSWPDFSYQPIKELGDFIDKPPTPKALKIIFPKDKLAPFKVPVVTKPTVVNVESLEMVVPTLTTLKLEPLPSDSSDLLTPYQEQLYKLLAEFYEWQKWLKQQEIPAKNLSQLIGTKLRNIMIGQETALPDTWESKIYKQTQHEILVQRYTALLDLDTVPGAITGLPSGSRDYARLTLELQALQSLMRAAAKTTTIRYQEEVKHLRWALQLASKWAEALANLFTDVQAWRLQGVQIALDGAQAALDAALKVLEFKEKEIALRVRYNEAQMRRLDMAIKVEKTKLDKLQIQVANNQLISTYNNNQAEIEAAATTYIDSQLSLFDSEVAYLSVEQDWQKLNYACFAAEVLAYQTRVNVVKAEHAALKARIKGDLVQADAELAKVQAYTVSLQAQENNAKALAIKTKVQAEQVRQTLTAYNVEVAAKLSWLRQLDSVVTVAARALVKGFDAETKVEQIKLARQEMKDQEALSGAWQALQEDQLKSLKIVKGHALKVSQSKSQGRIVAQGSGTLGSLAQAAYSGLNAIGAKMIIEEA